jgi:hypothetical protein
MKLGLYSITYLGLWYRGRELTLPQMISRARDYGYDGIEIDGKRPHGNPLDWTTARCADLRALADGEGIDIYAVAANNDFSNPVPEVREAQICFVRDLIRMTDDFGAPTLRVFLAWWGVTRHPQLATYDIAEGYWPVVHEKFPTEEIWDWCREALVECARYAGDAGVTLALQNHKPLINDHDDVLRMVREVGSPTPPSCPTAARPASTQERGRLAACRHSPTSAASSSAWPTVRFAASSATMASSARTRTTTTATSSDPWARSATTATLATSSATNCPSSTARRSASSTPMSRPASPLSSCAP